MGDFMPALTVAQSVAGIMASLVTIIVGITQIRKQRRTRRREKE